MYETVYHYQIQELLLIRTQCDVDRIPEAHFSEGSRRDAVRPYTSHRKRNPDANPGDRSFFTRYYFSNFVSVTGVS